MVRLKKFKWDFNEQYIVIQEDLSVELIAYLCDKVRDYYLAAVDLVGVETKLSRKVRQLEHIDYPVLSFIYEILAADFRRNYRGTEGQLTLFYDEEYADEWRSYWDGEINDLLGDTGFIRAVLECLVFNDEGTGHLAKEMLFQLLEDRYDLDWQQIVKDEQKKTDSGLPAGREVLPYLENVNKIYKANPFRVLGMFGNTEASAIHRAFQRLLNRTEVGRDVQLQQCLLLDPVTCGSQMLRNAYNALHNLEERLKFRLFWFVIGDQEDEQIYHDLISGREEKALDRWSEKASTDDYFAAQNLVICKHLRAIHDDPTGHGDPNDSWSNVLSMGWAELLYDSGFWLHYESMERDSGWQPQAVFSDIEQLQENCWCEILNINIELAFKYWDEGRYEVVSNHLKIIKESEFPREVIEKAEEKIIKYVELDVGEACRDFLDKMRRDVEDASEQSDIKEICDNNLQELQGHLLPLVLTITNMEFENYLTQYIRRKVSNVVRELAVTYNNKLHDYLKAEELIYLARSLLSENDHEFYEIKDDIKIISENAGNYKARLHKNSFGPLPEELDADEAKIAEGDEFVEAAGRGDLDTVIASLEHGVIVNYANGSGKTALMAAGFSGHADVVQVLINAGANLNLQTNHGYTALMWASQRGYYDVVQQLLNHGANIFLTNNRGETALTLAQNRSQQKDFGLIVDLLRPLYDKYGPSKSKRDDTLLMHAAYNGLTSMAEELLDSGVEINSTNAEGKTALVYAAFHGHVDMVNLLIDRGADTSIKDNQGWNAYRWAIYGNELQTAKIIKQRSGLRGLFFK